MEKVRDFSISLPHVKIEKRSRLSVFSSHKEMEKVNNFFSLCCMENGKGQEILLLCLDEKLKFSRFLSISRRNRAAEISRLFPIFRAAERWKFLDLFPFLRMTKRRKFLNLFLYSRAVEKWKNLDLLPFFRVTKRWKFLDFFPSSYTAE